MNSWLEGIPAPLLALTATGIGMMLGAMFVQTLQAPVATPLPFAWPRGQRDPADCLKGVIYDTNLTEVPSLEGLQLQQTAARCLQGVTLTDQEVQNSSFAVGNYTIVSQPRLQATLWLLWAALWSVEGDVVETGVFTGGSTAMMLKFMLEKGARCRRKLWAFDSFQGLPMPADQDQQQGGIGFVGQAGAFTTTRGQFDNNMASLLVNHTSYNDSLVVTTGWFNDTLPVSPVKRIAFLRLDGDLYVSTMDGLLALYDRVSPGGYIYVDDYLSFRGCKRAVDDFRAVKGISAPLHLIKEQNTEAVWWRKPLC